MAFVERSRILTNVGQGLLCRLYLQIRKLNSSERPMILSSKDFKIVRSKTEKSFPELIDYTKVQGGDLFINQALLIKESLESFDHLMIDLIEFSMASLEFLQEFLRQLSETKFEKNQLLTLLYFDLFVCYIRVMLLFASIEDRKMIYAVYTAATATANIAKSTFWSDAITLLARSDNLNRHFIDAFGSLTKQLKPLLLQVKAALLYAENVDTMRNNHIFNPMYDGVDMGRPVHANLSQSLKLSAHTELLHLQKYTDYVIFIHLACPPLLYDDFCFDLFKQVSSGILFVEIFRDVAMSIHDEFEKLLIVFPSKQDKDTFQKPHGYKLKNKLKDIAKIAITDTPLRLKTRRSYIIAELHNLRKILLVSPGLIGPKFPMLLAALAYGKKECLTYFQHIDQQESIRKDCKKLYILEDYISSNITSLLYEIYEVNCLIQKYRCIIVYYYSEYIVQNDIKSVEILSQQLGSKYSSLRPLLDSLPTTLKDYLIGTGSNTATSSSSSYVSNSSSSNLASISTWCHESLLHVKNSTPSESFQQEMNKLNGFYYNDYLLSFIPNSTDNATTGMKVTTTTNATNNNGNKNPKNPFVSITYTGTMNPQDDTTSTLMNSGRTPYGSLTLNSPRQNDCNLNFEGFRLNYERCLYLMSTTTLSCFSSNNPTDNEISEKFTTKLNAIYWRTLYIDSIQSLLGTYVLPYEIYWYRTHFLTAHAVAFNHTGGMPYPYQSFVYIQLTKYITFSAHSDAIEEYNRLIELSTSTSHGMIDIVKNHIINQIDILYDHHRDLNNQCRPIEAGNRLQRVLDTKKKMMGMGGLNLGRRNVTDIVDPLPGSESEIWAKSSIQKMKSIQNNVNQLMSAIQTNRYFLNHHQQYDYYNYIFKSIHDYLYKKYQSLYFHTLSNTLNSFERMSYAKIKFLSICGVIQNVLSCTQFSAEFPQLIRSLLCKELFEYTMPFPGQKIPHNLTTDHIHLYSNTIINTTPSDAATNAAIAATAVGNNTGNLQSKFRSMLSNTDPSKDAHDSMKSMTPLIWRITSWFESIIEALIHPKCVHILTEKKQSIIPLPTTRYIYQTSSEIDTKFNIEDLRLLCTMIGPQGVRVIDSHLIKLIGNKLVKIPAILYTQKTLLTQIRTEFASNLKIVTGYRGLPELENALLYIGVCLSLRKMLHNALSEGMQVMIPSITDGILAITASVAAAEDINITTPLYTLATDIGVVPALDLSLIQSLAPVFDLPSDNIWKLFPIAAALLFMSDRFDHANYNLTHECFEKNEHCIMTGVTKILLCISANDNILSEFLYFQNKNMMMNLNKSTTVSINNNSPRNGQNKLIFPKSGLEQFQILPKVYFQISCQLLLYLRSMDGISSTYDYKKMRSTTLLLEIFIQEMSPVFIDRSVVEKYFPYMILHSSLTDVSLNRHKFTDSLGSYSKSKRDPQMTAAGALSAENSAPSAGGTAADSSSGTEPQSPTGVGEGEASDAR